MAIRLRSEFTDWHGIDWKIDISDSEYFGSVQTFVTMADSGGIEFSRSQDNDQPFFSPLVTTTANIYMSTESAGTANIYVDAFVADLPNGKENQFQCVIYRNNVRYFVGMLLTDGVQWVDEAPTTINIQATDGLMRLEQIPFTFATTATNHQYALGRYLQEALKFCALESFFNNTEVYIKSTISWRADEQRNLNDVLTDARMAKTTFIEDEETGQPVNCLDAIRIILKAIGANIRFDNGCWFVSQFSSFNYTNVATYDYSKTTNWGTDDAYLGVYNPTFTVPARAISAGLNHAWRPSVRYCRVNWQMHSKLTFSKYPRYTPFDPVFAKSAITGSTTDIANFASGSTKFTFYCSYNNRLIGWQYNNSNPREIEVGINIFINLDNTWYLGQQNGRYIWTTNNTQYVFYNSIAKVAGIGFADGYIAERETGSFVIPPPPAGNYTQLNLTITAGERNGAYRNGNMAFYGWGQFEQLIGDDNQPEAEVTFESENSINNAASIEVEEEIQCGTVPVDWVGGKLQVYNNTAWVNATKFYDALETSPTSEFLPKMLAIKTIEYQRQPRETIEGEILLNNYNTTRALSYDGRKWAFLEGTYRVSDGAWEGTWVEMQRQSTGFTTAAANPNRDRFRKYADGIGGLLDVGSGHGNSIGDIYEKIGDIKKDIDNIKKYLDAGVDGYLLQFIKGLPNTAENGANYTLVAKAGTGSSAPFTLEWKAP